MGVRVIEGIESMMRGGGLCGEERRRRLVGRPGDGGAGAGGGGGGVGNEQEDEGLCLGMHRTGQGRSCLWRYWQRSSERVRRDCVSAK